MPYTRRKFVQHAGVGLLTFTVAGCEKELTPAAARIEGLALQAITQAEATTLDRVGDVLVPGSAAAGLSHYVDHQLNATDGERLLMIKYLGVPGPYLDFYRGGLRAINEFASGQHGKPTPDLSDAEVSELVAQLAAGDVGEWQGPPAGLLYFVLRADAVDVTFGTAQGFADLDVPYMAHIEPPSRWGE